MSLPPGFLDELRGRVSISQVVGRKVTWDARKSNAGKGDYWSPCPFHQEKTASFHVDDRKGFFYCFGCHQKGDALTFIRETENVSFMEAVEILAREGGMTMPARDPRAQEKSDKRAILVDVMEQSTQFFRLQLKTARGTAARDYLDGRGLNQAAQDRFEIGFAPDDRTALYQHLIGKGATPEAIIDSGMAIKPDDGGNAYDRFRGRIIFPIRDPRGRCIAFGGRAMDPNARAKYLNSPETLLFDKGRTLYHHAPAREAAGKAQSLIVAEGYMDVIALAEAGFAHSVAPLGTAITEDQLNLMWRISPEPIIALDGDKAGVRAAMRLMDLAFPLLEAGKSLRFCIMPEGLDPDDLIKASGPKAMQKQLDAAQPMVNLLWQREIEGKVFDSPERRAALDASLRTILNTIKDASVRNHYMAAIKELRRDLFAPARSNNAPYSNAPYGQQNNRFGSGQRGQWNKRPPVPTAGAKSSLLARDTSDTTTQRRIRESVILCAAILCPKAAQTFEAQIERCPVASPDLQQIYIALLELLPTDLSNDIQHADGGFHRMMTDRLGFDPIDQLSTIPAIRQHPFLKQNANPDYLMETLKEELAKHAAIIGAEQEIQDAVQDIDGLADEGLTWRIEQATQARETARQAPQGETNTSEDDKNMSDHLQKMLDDQIWVKNKQ